MRYVSCFVGVLALLSCFPPDPPSTPPDCSTDASLCDCVQDSTLCAKTPGTRCDGTLKMCIPTSCSPACSGATPFCDETATQCVATCANDGECAGVSAAKPTCFKPQGQARGSCVECVTSATCTSAAKPVCDTMTNQCVGCTQDSECGTDGFCFKAGDCPNDTIAGTQRGQCIRGDQFTFVNNDNTKCAAAGPGTQGAMAYCTVAQAVGAGKTLIRVAGSATKYAALNVATGNLLLVGPGRSANPPAEFDQVNQTGGSLILASGIQVNPAAQTVAVSCSGAASSLSMVDSVVKNAVGRGVSVTGCGKVCIERNKLTGIARSAIVLDGTSSAVNYRLVNNAITSGGNGTEQYAVNLGTNASGYFGFNTITRYAAGVACASTTQFLDSSIIINNAAQQTFGCTTTARDTVTTGTVTFEAMNDEPKLKVPDANNTACCIDKIQTPTGTGPAPLVDYFGKKRPAGSPARYELGMYEIQP